MLTREQLAAKAADVYERGMGFAGGSGHEEWLSIALRALEFQAALLRDDQSSAWGRLGVDWGHGEAETVKSGS